MNSIPERPDPDQLLKRVQAEEASEHKGRLKLFFGACPGVGKTYAMLEAARQRKAEGLDVVIGIVETHGRVDTEALLSGLEILPRRMETHRGVKLTEFDLDHALQRRPNLVLVDELAHTNAPGSRHAKRWQDVDELLDAGIDVYTTLNVQHWESLNDVVAQITGVQVQETVPDTFLQKAHELELVDLPPDELLLRLKEGKVYKSDLATHAAERFFKRGNLIALRELALRHTAERVDEQIRAYREKHSIEDIWQTSDRLLVGITASPMAARLVRATHRLAKRLHATWFAIHVETPAATKISPDENARLIAHLTLAEKLGAEIVTLTGEDVTAEILNYAREQNVTKIIIGKPARPRWKDWFLGSVVDELARQCGDIDLYIINGIGHGLNRKSVHPPPSSIPWKTMAQGTSSVILSTLISWPMFHHIDRANLVMIYLTGVVWSAYRFGRTASITTSILSVLAFDFFFVPPHLTFAVSDTQYLITFIAMLIVGFSISTLTGRLRAQTDQMRRRETRLQLLYKLSRQLSETPEVSRLFRIACEQLETFYRLPILLLIPNQKTPFVVVSGDTTKFGFDAHEESVARWAFDHGQLAGAGTDTLSGSRGLYLPMKGRQSPVGVLGILAQESDLFSDPEYLQLLETFASIIGGALESTQAAENMGKSEARIETERLKNLLLSTFSMELKEPLRELVQAFRVNNEEGMKQQVLILERLIEELPNLLQQLDTQPSEKTRDQN